MIPVTARLAGGCDTGNAEYYKDGLKAEGGTLVKVLIGIDSSPSSERVLEAALARPWPPETTFCVLNIVDLQGFSRLPALIEEARR